MGRYFRRPIHGAIFAFVGDIRALPGIQNARGLTELTGYLLVEQNTTKDEKNLTNDSNVVARNIRIGLSAGISVGGLIAIILLIVILRDQRRYCIIIEYTVRPSLLGSFVDRNPLSASDRQPMKSI